MTSWWQQPIPIVYRRVRYWLRNKRRVTYITPIGDIHLYSPVPLSGQAVQMMPPMLIIIIIVAGLLLAAINWPHPLAYAAFVLLLIALILALTGWAGGNIVLR